MSTTNNGVPYYLAHNNKLVQPARNTNGVGGTATTLFFSYSGNSFKFHGVGSKYLAGFEASDIEATGYPGTAEAVAVAPLSGQTI